MNIIIYICITSFYFGPYWTHSDQNQRVADNFQGLGCLTKMKMLFS